MPRDDLSIDFIGRRGKMVQSELQDPAAVLEEWVNRVANLPAEIAFMQEEIEQKDRQMQECIAIITKHDTQIQKWIRTNGSHVPNPKDESSSRIILENYDKAQVLQAEKIALAQKTQIIMDKHTRWLDAHFKGFTDRGEFSLEADFPSLLKDPQPNPVAAAAVMPLGPINNSASVAHTRHPNQHPPRGIPAHVQAAMGQTSSSAPATPASAMLPGRHARETSLGAANKRQKLTGGVPLQTSSLARQASNVPGTPRGGTPISARASSAGPRSSQTTTKKVGPQSSRPNGAPRKHKKSTLSRIKGARNKNSPSSTNDSELSDAESGSVDDEEAHTPAGHRDGDGDEDMADPDDDNAEGDDGKVYCLCQKVSFGDMVACDNDKCPYEWFHWGCVGLKSEPEGTWICPVCTPKAPRK
jgi:inhibitor of growth protein 3